jgi:hypothetical protein
MFAGMLFGKVIRDAEPRASLTRGAGDLVSWNPGARSRREDELARSRQAGFH